MNLEQYIRDIVDFPKEGIVFKDITTLLINPEAFCYTIDKFAEKLGDVDKIVGLDARGFIFASAVAYKLKKPLVIVRKTGKLPHDTITESYSLEYGKNSMDIHIDSINKGDKIAIVDDLLATGGTVQASINLVEKLGGVIDSLNFVIELDFLEANKKLSKYNINSLVHY
ncbi:adenine phosphoribosyltransferase [Candidatus Gracilibacteria bacterium]|nr:adenine phosphoribosyltransferase [Candidatus Gracilibacteria bacterium]